MSHQINHKDIQELIAGFFTGELNDHELTRLNNWLDEDEANLTEFNRLRSTWISTHHAEGKKQFGHHPGWQKLQRKIYQKNRTSHKKRTLQRLTPMRYAASLLFCLMLGSVLTFMLRRNQSAEPPALTMATTTISAPLGSKSNIILPDGSTVWLNAGSTITYPADFGQYSRELQLLGEAFFAVKSDSMKPFNVHTPGMTVRAFGTRFNVKAYPDDEIIAATLEEGIVDVLVHTGEGKPVSQPVKLRPSEQLIVRKSPTADHQASPEKTSQKTPPATTAEIKEIVLIPNVKTELSTSWKDKKWIISDEPLDGFVTDLERRYNLNIRFATEELKEYKFTGTIENETVEQILTALSIAAPVNYKFDKNNVLLTLNTKDKDG